MGEVADIQFLKQLEKKECIELDGNFNFESCKSLVFWGVKSLGHRKNNGFFGSAEDKMHWYQFILSALDEITPRQLISIFPITKVYDGKKYGMKDYFYTMGMCENHGLDKKIGDSFEFLWDYFNRDIGGFVVNYLSTLSDVHKEKNGKSLAEIYFAEAGITTYSEKNIGGKSVMVENLQFNSKGKLI